MNIDIDIIPNININIYNIKLFLGYWYASNLYYIIYEYLCMYMATLQNTPWSSNGSGHLSHCTWKVMVSIMLGHPHCAESVSCIRTIAGNTEKNTENHFTSRDPIFLLLDIHLHCRRKVAKRFSFLQTPDKLRALYNVYIDLLIHLNQCDWCRLGTQFSDLLCLEVESLLISNRNSFSHVNNVKKPGFVWKIAYPHQYPRCNCQKMRKCLIFRQAVSYPCPSIISPSIVLSTVNNQWNNPTVIPC